MRNIMRCNMIGAGRLGKNIALALSSMRFLSSLTICNSKLENAQKACQAIGFGQAVEQLEDLPEAELIWLCPNDDMIAGLVETLANQNHLQPGCYVVHSSGVLSSDILAPLKEKGCFIASFHPLKAFKTNYLDATAFNQVDCVLEGDEEVCHWLTNAFTHLGAFVTSILPTNKAMYHAAACIASNYLITLAAHSEALFLNAGLSPTQSRRMLVNLMQGNLNNLNHTKTIAEALTGPLVRGDSHTLTLHLKAIKNSEILSLYQAAGIASLPLTDLDEKQRNEIANLLAAVSRETLEPI